MMIFALSSYSQHSRELLSTEEFNNQLKTLLEIPKIYKKTIHKNESGDINVYVDCSRFKNIANEKPINNHAYKVYYWDKESIFYNGIDSQPHLEVIRIETGPKNMYIELITRSNDKKEYFIHLGLIDFDDDKKERISPKIDKIKISTIHK